MSNPLSTPLPWDLVAADYGAEIVPLFTLYAEDALRLVPVGAGDRVLDVATGPGTLAILAAARGAKVSAIDFSAKMVAELRARSARECAVLDVHAGDAQALPFADSSFDMAFSMFGLMFFPDRARGFAELHRVLVPGGRAAVSSWDSFDGSSTMGTLFGAIADVMGGPPSEDRGFALSDPAVCRQEMAAAGFRDVVVHRVTHGVDAPSLDTFWASACRTNAALVSMREAVGERWPAVSQAIRDRMAGEIGDGPLRMEMPALITVGHR